MYYSTNKLNSARFNPIRQVSVALFRFHALTSDSEQIKMHFLRKDYIRWLVLDSYGINRHNEEIKMHFLRKDYTRWLVLDSYGINYRFNLRK